MADDIEKAELRKQLEEKYGVGNVYDTDQLQEKFEVISFVFYMVECKRKSDGVCGVMDFNHMPRLYYGFSKE